MITSNAVELTYTVTDAISGDPIPDVNVWFTTDGAGNCTTWTGTTDTLGVARDANNKATIIDNGTYFVWRQKQGYMFSDPDIIKGE